jgi:transposase
VYDVQDCAEVRRLHRDGWSNSAVAEKFGMSRNTVAALIARSEPPRYERRAAGSVLDPFADPIAAMLDEDPKAPATVIRERLQALGYAGGISILKEHLAALRPTFLAARSYQRTSYLPGELGQADWWETGVATPVGKGASREAFGLVTSLPHSAAHATVFTFSKTTADFCPAFVGCLERLGGVPQAMVLDNDTAMVKPRRGGPAQLVDDVAALFGALCLKPIVLRPRHPEGEGQDERMIGYLQTSFVPLRRFASLEDLQHQHDVWAGTVAFERRPRRRAGTVAEAWRVERGFLAALPRPLPSTDQHVEVRVSKDGFIRFGNVDYSVPPGHSGLSGDTRCTVLALRPETSVEATGDDANAGPVSEWGHKPVLLPPVLEREETTMTDDELREFFEQTMAELSPRVQDLREELARVSELLDEARATDTLDPRFAGLSNLVVGLMDVEIRALQLVDALARHALA